jgi:hypothetical protein
MLKNRRQTKKYRKIWEEHNGPIPKDKIYDIHHIDGDHTNNHIDNLKLVTLEEHYDIHLKQEEYGACMHILRRMDVTKEQLSEMVSKSNSKRIAEGTHNFLGERNPNYLKMKKWLVTFPNGAQEVIVNLAKFCREHNLSKGNVCGAKKSKGYIFTELEKVI